jgi:hypothetical protein
VEGAAAQVAHVAQAVEVERTLVSAGRYCRGAERTEADEEDDVENTVHGCFGRKDLCFANSTVLVLPKRADMTCF